MLTFTLRWGRKINGYRGLGWISKLFQDLFILFGKYSISFLQFYWYYLCIRPSCLKLFSGGWLLILARVEPSSVNAYHMSWKRSFFAFLRQLTVLLHCPFVYSTHSAQSVGFSKLPLLRNDKMHLLDASRRRKAQLPERWRRKSRVPRRPTNQVMTNEVMTDN